MTVTFRTLRTLALSLLAAAAASAQPLPDPAPTGHPTAEAFGQIPAISDPQLSPDGKYFVTIESLRGYPAALIYHLGEAVGTSTNPIVIPSTDWIIERVGWTKNDRVLVYFKKYDKARYNTQVDTWETVRTRVLENAAADTWRRLRSFSVDGKTAETLMRDRLNLAVNYDGTRIVDLDPDDPENVLAELYTTKHPGLRLVSRLNNNLPEPVLDLLKVNVRTGKSEVLMHGNEDTSRWLTDGHGNVVGRIDSTKHPERDHLFLLRSGNWQETASFDAAPDMGLDVLGLTPDGKSLVLSARDGTGTRVLLRYDMADGQTKPFFSVPGYDVGDAILDPWTKQVIGVFTIDDRLQRHYFDTASASIQQGLEKAFPGLTVEQTSSDLAGDKLIVRVEGPQNPPAYYFFDRDSHRATLITSAYPGLDQADLGEMKPYPYRARDGLAIPAYLTLPPGKAPKNLPAVIMLHGGPDARDEVHFDWETQFLANRGYAVLQPNFRGSSGYGREFTAAGLHQWGLKMQDDVSDGVKKLIADGIADPKRICVAGADYGGYAALAGAALTPELYACAVSWAGVADLPTQLGTAINNSGRDSRAVQFWSSRIGSAYEDSERLRATSPALQAANVRAPVLLMHGEADTTVRIGQSEIMERALRQAGKTVVFIRFSGGEDHAMNLRATRIQVLKETEKFLKENIGN